MSAREIDDYLDHLPEPKRGTLQHVRAAIRTAAPDAEEGLSYGVPAFRVDGRPIAGFSAAKRHLSYLPHSGEVLGRIDPELLAGYGVSRGSLRFAVDEPLPDALVAILVAARRAELAGDA